MKQAFKKKVSIAIAAMMMMSMLMPVMSYAAVSFGFYYYEDRGLLAGGIYTADPDNVKVEMIDDSGAATEIDLYIEASSNLYDDNNTLYYYKSYRANVADKESAPTKIKVIEGDKEYILEQQISEVYSTYNYPFHSDENVDLDLYRMSGAEHMSGKQPGTFLQSGDKLVTFTPLVDGYNAIEVKLPSKFHYDQNDSRIVLDTTAASDFILTDTSVSQSVYAVSIHHKVYFNNETNDYAVDKNRFILQFPEGLKKDVAYELALSINSEGNEIILPPSGGTYLASVAYGQFHTSDYAGATHNYVYGGNIAKFKNVTFPGTVTPNPTPSPSPAPETPSTGGIADPNQGKQVVNADDLKNGKDGVVSVAVSDSKPEVLLPVNAGEAVGSNKLRLENDALQVEIPANILKQLQALLPSEQLEGAQISFSFNKVTDSAAAELLNRADAQSGADIEAAGDIYDFILSVIGKDGKSISLTQFSEPITISLKVSADANKELLGIYYISDSGVLEYVGGQLKDGFIQAQVAHFSKYAALEFDKSYSDVAANHWAADIIKSMSAKHIIQGKSEDSFAPDADVTRAEFASMLVRALGLKSTAASSFTDVSANAWYAEAVAAASEAGIIQGKSADTFAPNAEITREEMAALLVRAYELSSGNKLDEASEADFADRGAAADWALGYIDAAYDAGLINGRNGNQFAPKAHLTRAESAKVIYTLLVEE